MDGLVVASLGVAQDFLRMFKEFFSAVLSSSRPSSSYSTLFLG